jgi:hypothetical protein
MRKAILIERQTIVVPIVGENGKFEAQKWLWEYLRDNNLTAQTIYHNDKDIVAEVIVRTEEKEI